MDMAQILHKDKIKNDLDHKICQDFGRSFKKVRG